MSVVVACPKCQKKYKLPEKMLCKAIKCPSCNATFKVPAPAAGKQPGQPKAAAQPRDPQGDPATMKRLGLEGTIQKDPDLFAGAVAGGSDPLANHVVADPGFAKVQMESRISDKILAKQNSK